MAIFIFAPIDKKIISLFTFLLLSGVIYAILYIIDGIKPFENYYFDSFCEFFIYIPYFIYIKFFKKKRNKNKNENNELTVIKMNISNKLSSEEFRIKDYLLFILVISLDIIGSFLSVISWEDDNDNNDFLFNLFNTYTIQMLVLLLLSKCYRKAEYHLHQLISQIIITISSIVIDIILIFNNNGNNKLFKFKKIVVYLLSLTIEIIVLYYKKYLFEIKLFTIQKISFLFGIINFSIFLIINILYKMNIIFNTNNSLYNNIKESIKFVNVKYETFTDIIIIIVSFIFISLFYFCYYRIIQLFSPNYILFSYSIVCFIENLENIYVLEIYYIIAYFILFIFIIFNFLVYLELLELNFCNLNKNTRRNIMSRERTESMSFPPLEEEDGKEKNQNYQRIEIDGYYIYSYEE